MIRDTVEQIARETEQGLQMSSYCLPDLDMASVLGLNLVSFLEVAPNEITRCDPRWTFLEGEIVARNMSMLRYYARKVGDMQIYFESFHQIPQLWIDRDLTERVFLNLMINAIKYGAPSTLIKVVPRVSPGWYHVDIENNGIGISASDEKHIFKPYYRGARAKKRKLGVGLGLYIARIAMEKNGGALTLTKREDPTVFTMSFPARIARASINKS
jgi:K+-sensing histidine kinase KdpD